MATRKLGSYLNKLSKTSDCQGLSYKINQLNEMQQLIATIIPANLAKCCTLGFHSNEKLIIFADNGSIAARLKQILPSLLLKVKSLEREVTSIQIAVQAYHHTNGADNFSRKKRNLSQCGKDNLSQLAASLPTSALKSAVESLLKNG